MERQDLNFLIEGYLKAKEIPMSKSTIYNRFRECREHWGELKEHFSNDYDFIEEYCEFTNTFSPKSIERKNSKLNTVKHLGNPYNTCSSEKIGIYLFLNYSINWDTRQPLFLCKIGESGNLKQRIKSHSGSNPSLFHNNMFIETYSPERFEKELHKALFKWGGILSGNTAEFFLIDEDKFWLLKDNGKSILEKAYEQYKKYGTVDFSSITLMK